MGEIGTGILFGPTILGRLWPGLQTRLFPSEVVQQGMLETVSWFGVLFLLLATGFEVNISSDGGGTWTTLLSWSEDHDAYGPGQVVTLDITAFATATTIKAAISRFYRPA